MNNNNDQKSYTFSDIRRYLNGSMTASEMHDMERVSLQDPFLSDAIEGYRKTDAVAVTKHLNEINALLQNNGQSADVITMPKKRNYTWQIAASVIAVIGISIFFLYKQPNTNNVSALAENKVLSEQKKDSESRENITSSTPLLKDSLSAVVSNFSTLAKRKNTMPERNKFISKKKVTESANAATALPSANIATTMALQKDEDSIDHEKTTTMSQTPSPAMMDSQKSYANSASAFASHKAKTVTNNEWTTDKGKPFILSEVEEIKVGKKSKQKTDTAAIKPEGGWQSFQDYLFTEMGKKDTADFINAAHFNGDLELEFSITENGSPYNVKVIRAPDSTSAKTAADALQQGPKWITTSKKQKRLNIRY